MQLYALNNTGNKCNVHSAQKGNDYFCLECNGRVRVRSGKLLRAHFFHIQDAASCRQAGKSQEHITIQRLIRQQIGLDASVEEMKFDDVGRVADVAWPAKKLIFEVQCSPISQTEVEARNRDYASCGWDVIWILYDKTFNKKKLSLAESYLQAHTHYYSDSKCIYDQVRIVKRHKKAHFLQRRTITVGEVLPLAFVENFPEMPLELSKRFDFWLYFTPGDYLWELMQTGGAFAKESSKTAFALDCLARAGVRIQAGFKAVWQAILERSCR